MVAALWTLVGEWRKSGSGLLKTFAAPLRQLGEPLWEEKAIAKVISDSDMGII